MTALSAVLSLYAEHMAPFARHDDFYGNILLPSVIGNQKGRLRAIINRRPFFLYKAWALSTPESLVFLKRQEKELLLPLSDELLENGLKPICTALSTLPASSPSSSLSLSSIVETIFRFLIVSMQDEQALRLAAMFGDRAGLFLRRSSVLLCTVDPTLRRSSIIDDWMAAFDSETLHDLQALAGEGDVVYRRLPGETSSGAALFYSLFDNRSGSAILSELYHVVGSPAVSLERRSMQSLILYVFEALLSSGRLFTAFRLYQALAKSGSDQRIVRSMAEQCMRVALLNDRISLYVRLASDDDAHDHHRRLRYVQALYGSVRARAVKQLLHHNGIDDGSTTEPGSAGESDAVPDESLKQRQEHGLYNNFEELLLDEKPSEELRAARRYIASFAGDDYRLRALLGRFYQESEPETALRHYNVSSYPSLRRYLAMRLGQRLGRPVQKRDQRLRKMLESSSAHPDHGSGDPHERR